MLFKPFQTQVLRFYGAVKSILAANLRWQYPAEYRGVQIKTKHPGPKTKAMKDKLRREWEGDQTVQHFVNYKMSKGNYFKDVDGNVVLDLGGQGNTLPLGYNHDALINAYDSSRFDRFLMQRPSLACYPSTDYPDLIRRIMMPVAPKGHTEVLLVDGTGSLANEYAIKAAFFKYHFNKRKSAEYTESELKEAATNDSAASQRLCVLTFEGASHGSTLALSSIGNENGIGYKWPVAPFPEMKYPLGDNDKLNRIEEDRCLKQVEELIETHYRKNNEIAALMIEPIQQKGNRFATPYFYKKLQHICKENGITFIVDETDTGCGITGKMWAHENWYSDCSPDIVTFGKKTQVAGYYTTLEYRPQNAWKLFEAWMGDPVKLLQFETIWRTIQKDKLLELVIDTGSFLKTELKRVEREKGYVTNIRGYGTYMAFDVQDTATMLDMLQWLDNRAISCIPIGDRTIGLRPPLILEPRHAGYLRDSLLAYHPSHTSHKEFRPYMS